jgi:hypothetical protein
MKNAIKFDYKANLHISNNNPSLQKLVANNGGEVLRVSEEYRNQGLTGATWMQRVEYITCGEHKVGYQFCSGDHIGDDFGSLFFCPIQHDPGVKYAFSLVAPK